MSHYAPPLQDMQFVLNELVDLHEIAALPGYGEATPDLARAVLEEAGVFASEVIAPLNHSGDIEGVRLEGGAPRMPAGWAQAYARFVEGGWPALSAPEEQGGQNLPGVLAAAGVPLEQNDTVVPDASSPLIAAAHWGDLGVPSSMPSRYRSNRSYPVQ